MQTFLPYDEFEISAQALDDKRLGKQRVEVLQILKALIDESGWIHHPATKMWRGHTEALIRYGVAICDEWISRGHSDTCKDKILAYHNPYNDTTLPSWFGHKRFHASHRSNLKRKDPIHYKFEEPADLPYCWPLSLAGHWRLRFKHAGAPNYEEEVVVKL